MHRVLVTIALAVACIAAWPQEADPQLEAAVDRVLEMGAKDGPAAVDSYLKSMAPVPRSKLEGAFWRRWLREGRITRTEFARNMLSMNQELFPEDLIATDYWRYVVMLNEKRDAGALQDPEYKYLEGKKLDEARAAQRAQNARADAETAAAQSAMQQAQAQQRAQFMGTMLQSIGAGLRDRSRPGVETNCAALGTTVNCYSR